MKKSTKITHLFLDVGGVLLTDGWDHHSRRKAALNFDLKFSEIEKRHHIIFEVYEKGRLMLDEYLNLVIFYEKRSFSKAAFKNFMFAQSKPFSEMIDLVTKLKDLYHLKIAAVSNEARELNAYRIQKFKLDRLVDCFISSSFVHIRKPDVEIFHLALDIAQAKPQQVVYIENTKIFTQIAEGLGMQSILHTDFKSTSEKLGFLGLYIHE